MPLILEGNAAASHEGLFTQQNSWPKVLFPELIVQSIHLDVA